MRKFVRQSKEPESLKLVNAKLSRKLWRVSVQRALYRALAQSLRDTTQNLRGQQKLMDHTLKAKEESLEALEAALDKREGELNAAEAVLDFHAAGLQMEKTDFDSIADYIDAVMRAKYDPAAVRNELAKALAVATAANVVCLQKATVNRVVGALIAAEATAVKLEALLAVSEKSITALEEAERVKKQFEEHKANWLSWEAKRKQLEADSEELRQIKLDREAMGE